MKISFFYTPKPRQFRYSPRFYDPEREKFEELKAKYKLDHNYDDIPTEGDSELAYFQSRVRAFDRKKETEGFGIGSIFKRKKMPTFNYKPRFSQDTTENVTKPETNNSNTSIDQISYTKKISFRRPIAYDYEDESPIAESMPVSKIIIYAIVIVILLIWIFL